MAERHDFSAAVKNNLAKQVGHRCSVPKCRALTSGPHTDPEKAVNVGTAAHITAAAPGGPRFDVRMTEAQRKSAENGIWVCAHHGRLIDADEAAYTAEQLRAWKEEAKIEAEGSLGRPIQGSDLAASFETDLLNRVMTAAHFHKRLRRFIEDVSRLPDHWVGMTITPPSSYDLGKAELRRGVSADFEVFASTSASARMFFATAARGAASRNLDALEIQYRELVTRLWEYENAVTALLDWIDRNRKPTNVELFCQTEEWGIAEAASGELSSRTALRLVTIAR